VQSEAILEFYYYCRCFIITVVVVILIRGFIRKFTPWPASLAFSCSIKGNVHHLQSCEHF